MFSVPESPFFKKSLAPTQDLLSLLLSNAPGCKDFFKPSKPSHVGIHWKAPAESGCRGGQVGVLFCLPDWHFLLN